MDVSAHGNEATDRIAAACVGTNSDHSCKFDELMRYIEPKWKGSTDIGGDLYPDTEHAAEELSKKGYKSGGGAGKLFPDLFPNARQQPPPLSPVLMAVTDRIQAARRTRGDEFFARQLRSLKDAITYVEDARMVDQAEDRIDKINKKLVAEGVTWKVETKTRLGQVGAWRDVDIYQTLRNHPNVPQRIVDTIINVETNWLKEDVNAYKHDLAIKACQAAANRVFGDCNR